MDRIKKLQSKLKTQSILITSGPNLEYFANFTGSKGYLLITKNRAYFLTDFRYTEIAKKCVPKGVKIIETEKKFANFGSLLKKLRIKEIGFENNELTIMAYKSLKKKTKGVKFKPVFPLLQKIREQKEPQEISLLKKAQKLNEKTLEIVIKKFVRKGMTEKEIAWSIQQTAHELGCDGLAFSPIVAFGENSSMPHYEPSNRKLKKGDIILIDMGVTYKGYHSDISRTFFTAEPTAEQKKVYEIVLKAQLVAINGLKKGISGIKADALARDIIIKEGYGETFGHACGHGVGLEIHEIPSLAETYKYKLIENTVVTVEPGIYLEGRFGVRIEDIVIVREKRIENITKFSKNITILKI